MIQTSGELISPPVRIPIVIYKGVKSLKTEYEKYDIQPIYCCNVSFSVI